MSESKAYIKGWRDAHNFGRKNNPYKNKILVEAYNKGFLRGCDDYERS